MLTHMMDTSAWIAHIQQGPGWETISSLLRGEEERVGISALSLIELYGRLRAFGQEAEFEQILKDYRDLLAQIVPVDEAVGLQAVALRRSATARLPAIDAMIAAAAALQGAVLVHYDAHFSAIPADQVRQIYLGDV